MATATKNSSGLSNEQLVEVLELVKGAETQGALNATDSRSDQRELACSRESILP